MKVSVPDTSGDQSVDATPLSVIEAIKNHRITIKCVSGTVYVLEQDDGTTPSCQDVIDEGYPLATNETVVLHDDVGNPSLSDVFAACSTGTGELRIFS